MKCILLIFVSGDCRNFIRGILCWLKLSKATSAACKLANPAVFNGQNATRAIFSSVELISFCQEE